MSTAIHFIEPKKVLNTKQNLPTQFRKLKKVLRLDGFNFSTDVEPERSGYSEITNEGVTLRVMSTIVQIIKDFITKNPTASIEYFADENFKGDARR